MRTQHQEDSENVVEATLYDRGLDGTVGLWEVASALRKTPGRSREKIAFSLSVLERLLENGHIEAGDVTQGGSFESWGGTTHAVLSKIKLEWRNWPGRVEPGDIVDFRLTEAGKKEASLRRAVLLQSSLVSSNKQTVLSAIRRASALWFASFWSSEQTLGNRHLLLVDDEDGICESLKRVLEFEGFTVHVASNGQEGLEQLKTVKPCVILLDLMMPVMDGWQFAEALEADQARRSIPIVLLTAFADKAKGIRCEAILDKPFDLNVLLEKVKRAAVEAR
jgi:two-component system chemotaxis response regulator CheY